MTAFRLMQRRDAGAMCVRLRVGVRTANTSGRRLFLISEFRVVFPV